MTKRRCVYISKPQSGYGRQYSAKVYYEAGEFIGRFYRDGILMPNHDYFTNDREEAIATVEDGLRRLVSSSYL